MKKCILFFFLALILNAPKSGISNPIVYPSPQILISELCFTGTGSWTLELKTYLADPMFMVPGIIDSVVIQTNSGKARLLNFPLALHEMFFANPGDFSAAVTIDPVADTVRITTYSNPALFPYGFPVCTHTLVYGYPGCEIPLRLSGQSICSRENADQMALYFYLDNSPTPGQPNDTIGATFTLRGHFYDCRGLLISSNPWVLYGNDYFTVPVDVEPYEYMSSTLVNLLDMFHFDNNGFYSVLMLARNGNTSSMSRIHNSWGYANSSSLPCLPFSVNSQPGATIAQDIHLSDSSFLVGVNPVSENGFRILISPNPVTANGTFFFEADRPLKDAEVQIYTATGQMKLRLPVPDSEKGTIGFTKDQLGAAGIYPYTVVSGGKKIASGEILCQ
jgi:hypothetical protein